AYSAAPWRVWFIHFSLCFHSTIVGQLTRRPHHRFRSHNMPSYKTLFVDKLTTAGWLPSLSMLAISLAALLMSGCDARGADQTIAPPPEVDVASVLIKTVTLSETFTGRLEAPQTVLLRPRVSGYIEGVFFDEGEWVEAGDQLFQIDPRP